MAGSVLQPLLCPPPTGEGPTALPMRGHHDGQLMCCPGSCGMLLHTVVAQGWLGLSGHAAHMLGTSSLHMMQPLQSHRLARVWRMHRQQHRIVCVPAYSQVQAAGSREVPYTMAEQGGLLLLHASTDGSIPHPPAVAHTPACKPLSKQEYGQLRDVCSHSVHCCLTVQSQHALESVQKGPAARAAAALGVLPGWPAIPTLPIPWRCAG